MCRSLDVLVNPLFLLIDFPPQFERLSAWGCSPQKQLCAKRPPYFNTFRSEYGRFRACVSFYATLTWRPCWLCPSLGTGPYIPQVEVVVSMISACTREGTPISCLVLCRCSAQQRRVLDEVVPLQDTIKLLMAEAVKYATSLSVKYAGLQDRIMRAVSAPLHLPTTPLLQ